MKIAIFLSTSGHSGVDRSMALLLPSLLARGYQVDLIKVQRHGPYIDISHKCFRLIELPTRHTMTALPYLTQYLKAHAPDVLLVDKDRANRVALMAKLIARSSVRVVVSSGTIMSINLKNRSLFEVFMHKLSMNHLYKLAHAIIVPCRYAADDLAEITSISRDRISVVPLPIVGPMTTKASDDSTVDHPWLNDSVPVIISVGELCDRKDQLTQLRAFKEVVSKRPCRMLIVGKGKNRQALESTINALSLGGVVELVGYCKNPYPLMKKARLFIHTAKFEGFGMVLVESLYLGTEVVSTDCPGGPREILAEGRHGGLVPVGDAEKLAEEILQQLDAEPRALDVLRKTVDNYTVSASTDHYLEVMGLPKQLSV